MKSKFQFIFVIFKKHKLKLLVFLLSPFVFFHLMFDYGSLSGLVSEQINAALASQAGASRLQRQQVQISYDDLNFHIIPFFGLGLSQIDIFVPNLFSKPLHIEEVIVGPEWRSLLSFREGVNLAAYNLFGGDLRLTLRGLKGKTAQEVRKGVDLNLENLNLGRLITLLELPVEILGTLNGTVEGEADLTLTQQPRGEFSLHIQKLKLPKDVLAMGFLIPGLDLKKISLKGTLKEGLLTISEFKIGQEGDELVGQISGDMDLKLPLAPMHLLATMPMRYRLNIDLSFEKSLESKLSLLLSFINSFKSQQGNHSRYAFKVSGQRLLDPSTKLEPL